MLNDFGTKPTWLPKLIAFGTIVTIGLLGWSITHPPQTFVMCQSSPAQLSPQSEPPTFPISEATDVALYNPSQALHSLHPFHSYVAAHPLTCEMSTLDIAIATQHAAGLPSVSFLWPNGPEDRGAMQGWFNSREKYGIALLERTLLKKNKETETFVDIGCHQGWFMTVVGALGFKAIGFDMQRLCVRLNRCGAMINGFTRHEVHHVYVSPTTDNKPVLADANTCRGGAQVLDAPSDKERVPVYPIHAGNMLLGRDIRIAAVKIDTEGFEPFILETLEPVMDRIDTIIFEISPHMWSSFGLTFEQGISRISKMWTKYGFTGIHLPEGNVAFDVCNPAPEYIYNDVPKFELFMRATLAKGEFVNVALKKGGVLALC